jgi:PhoH-like ATPase
MIQKKKQWLKSGLFSLLVVFMVVSATVVFVTAKPDSETYEGLRLFTDMIAEIENNYDGVIEKDVTSNSIDAIFKDKEVVNLEVQKDLFPNEGVLLKSHKNSAVLRFIDNRLKLIQENQLKMLSPRNLEQKVAIDILLDKKVDLVTITGGAGSGKTYLALSVAFHHLLEAHNYKKLILIKPTQETDLGFLPGSEQEKLNPYMASYYDSFSKILPFYSKKVTDKDQNTIKVQIQELIEDGMLEMKNFSYLRGRSLDDTLIIVDECQQITPHFA